MSILIQAGHHSSVSELLMQKLYDRGLNRPIKSFSHGLNHEQVTETIDKIIARSGAPEVSHKLSENVIVDLLLANIDYENWGWQAEKNLTALSYWHKFGNDVHFILVFDHPKNLFRQLNQETLTTNMLEEIISNWIDYHQNMLDALELYQDKSILIEGKAGLNNLVGFKNKVQTLATTLELKSSWQIVMSNDLYEDKIAYNDTDLTLEIITEEILCKYPEAISVFNKLLSKASIKCSDNILKTKRVELDRLLLSLNHINSEQLETELLLKNQNLQDSIENLEASNKELERKIKSQQHKLNNDIKILEASNKQLKQKIDSQHKASMANTKLIEEKLEVANKTIKKLQSPQNKLDDLQASNMHYENKLLMQQLMSAQEDLEKLYDENRKLNNISSSNKNNSSTSQALYGAADVVKQDLPYKLGEKVVKAKSAKAISKLPIELIKEYKNFQVTKDKNLTSPKLEDYLDVSEAEKVKKHLSYQVGKTIVDSMSSPKKMLLMPLSVSQRVITFKKNKP